MHKLSCCLNTSRLSCWAISLLLLLAPLAQAEENYGKPGDPLVAEALGVQIRTTNPDEMAYAIKQVLYFNYTKKHNLKVSKEEIAQFIKRSHEANRREAVARRTVVEKALASKDLADKERKQLEKELGLLKEADKALADLDQNTDTPEGKAAEATVAEAFIMMWKVNQAMYKQYGGRVIFQQGGPEPLDAWYKFLKESQQAGDFTIIKKEFAPALWDYYTTDSKHSFYPENSKEKDIAMNTPWWTMDMAPEGAQ